MLLAYDHISSWSFYKHVNGSHFTPSYPFDVSMNGYNLHVHHGQSQRLYVYHQTSGTNVKYSLNAESFRALDMSIRGQHDLVEIHGTLCWLTINDDGEIVLVSSAKQMTGGVVSRNERPLSSISGHGYIPTNEPSDKPCSDSLSVLWCNTDDEVSYIWTHGGVWSLSELSEDKWMLRDPRVTEPHVVCSLGKRFDHRTIIGANDDMVYTDYTHFVLGKANRGVSCFDVRNCAYYYIIDLGERLPLALVG